MGLGKHERVIRVFGLRRSGNHLFIRWLLQQQVGEVCFFNNVDLNDVEMRNPDDVLSGGGPGQTKLYSFEDRNLNVAANPRWIRAASGDRGLCTDFVVLRQPPNLFASRIKAGMVRPLFRSGLSVPELAYQYFNMCDDCDDWKVRFDGQLIPVVYDDFIVSEEYRRHIAKLAGVDEPRADISLGTVDTRFGRGSSFNPGSEEPASKAELLNRWREMKSDRVLRKWLREFLGLTRRGCPSLCDVDREELYSAGIVEPMSCVVLHRRVCSAVYSKLLGLLRASDLVTRMRSSLWDRRDAKSRSCRS